MGSSSDGDLVGRVRTVVSKDRAIDSVELTGSRSRGDAIELSDWDFKIETRNFLAVAAGLQALVYPLRPIAQQWDRLSEHACYMLMLRGIGKVDLIFDEPWESRPPWRVSKDTLWDIDWHFWDWTIWLAAKDRAGKRELVETELRKMQEHLLGPLGVERVPSTVSGAVAAYTAARAEAEKQLGIGVPRALDYEVRRLLSAGGYAI